MLKITEYPAEIARVRREIKETRSPYRRADLQKYLKRLEKEVRMYRRYTKPNKPKETQNGN